MKRLISCVVTAGAALILTAVPALASPDCDAMAKVALKDTSIVAAHANAHAEYGSGSFA